MRVPKSFSPQKRKNKKQQGIDARDAFSKYINGKTLVVELVGTDKYGRVLGKLFAFPDGIPNKVDLSKYDVCEYMIDNGYGYAYMGGKKKVGN